MNKKKIAKELLSIAKLLTAVGWDKLPKGWTQDSVKKFWGTLTGEKKHKVTACHKKMKDKMGEEGAWKFCASLCDMITPGWRGKK